MIGKKVIDFNRHFSIQNDLKPITSFHFYTILQELFLLLYEYNSIY